MSHWLPVAHLINYNVIMGVFRLVFSYIADMFELYMPARELRSQRFTTLVKPRTKIAKYGDKSFKTIL